MTDEVADHRAVLLLDPGLVVLAVRPRTGELDAPLGAVLGESIVDESSLMNTLSLSESMPLTSMPLTGKGSWAVRWPPVLCSIRASVDV